MLDLVKHCLVSVLLNRAPYLLSSEKKTLAMISATYTIRLSSNSIHYGISDTFSSAIHTFACKHKVDWISALKCATATKVLICEDKSTFNT